MKKVTSILLLCALILSSFAACSDSKGNENSSDTAQTGSETAQSPESAAETEAETELTHNLPSMNFDGETCTALVRTARLSHFTAEEFTGEALNDAVYERNMRVSDEFGVEFKFVDCEDNSATFNNIIGQSVMARDSAYDIVAPDYWWKTEVGGWFLNLKTVNYLDLDMPWWCNGWNEAAEIDGMLPGAVGFYTLDMIQNMNMIYFNKNLYESLSFDSTFNLNGLYDTVREGNWTYDLFCQMSDAAASDLNGDGTMSDGDRYGTLSELQAGRALLWSNGLELCTKDENGELTPTLSTEKNYDIFQSVLEFYKDSANRYDGDINKIFSEDKSLFLMSAVGNAVYLRDMESDFGVIPYPKYNPEDETYRSRNFGSSYFAIPITAKNIDMSAVILEAQNFYSYRDVRPTYYETILKEKVSRDADTSEMLDLIIDSCYIDTFFIYGSNLSFVADAPFNIVLSKTDTYMSTMKTHEKVIGKLLDKFISSLQPKDLS